MKKVSIVIPVYNEAKRLETCVLKVKDEIEKITPDYEIIIAEDGSTDGTDKLAGNLSRAFKQVLHQHYSHRLGKGGALKSALKISQGDIFIFLDVDLATDLSHLKELIDEIKNGYDIVIGSRRLAGSKVKKPIVRKVATFFYNSLIELLFQDEIRDHQCGFKAFKRKPLMKIIDSVEDNKWFFDTEVLIKAKKRGYRVKEIPVVWKEPKNGTDTNVSVANDGSEMFLKAIKLKVQSLKEENTRAPVRYDFEHSKPKADFSKISNILSENDTKFIFIFAIIWGSIFAYWFYANHMLTILVDENAHLNVARQIIDSKTPGFSQLTLWTPPLLHLMMLPFTMNDFLWHSGLAGTIPSLFLFAFAITYIYKIVRLHSGNKMISLLAVFIFALNPNVLYFASIPMTEMLFMAIFLAATYYFFEWMEDPRPYYLIFASFLTSALTWTRYDGWFIAPLLLILILIKMTARKENFAKIEGTAILFSFSAFFGIFLWMSFSYMLTSNPLEFVSGEWSAFAQQHSGYYLPSEHNLFNSVLYYGVAAGRMISYPIMALSVLSGLFLIKKNKSNIILILVLLSPAFFYILSLFNGNGVIYVPELAPHGNLNIRYGLVMILFSSITLPLLVANTKRMTRYFGIFVILILSLNFFNSIFFEVKMFSVKEEATYYPSETMIDDANYFKNVYDGGDILITRGINDFFVINSGIQMSKYIQEANGVFWENALNEPWKYARWIVMYNPDKKTWETEKDEISQKWGKNDTIYAIYDIKKKDDMYIILRLKESHIPENMTVYLSESHQ